MPWAAISGISGRIAPALLGLSLLTGCGLPAPDGTEAAITARAAGLPPLAPAKGQDAAGMVRNGLLLHPNVRQAASRVSASADEVRVQRAALFPGLGLTLGGGVGDAGDGDAALKLQGDQLLFDFGDTKRAVSSADIDLQVEYLTFQKSVDDAIVELLTAYDAVRMQAALLELRRKQLLAMQELATKVQERNSAGASSSPDLLETRKRLQTAEFLVLDTELALADARDRLTRLSGQAEGGRMPALRGATCKGSGQTDDQRIARLQFAGAEIGLQRAERARLPRVSLSPVASNEIGEGKVNLGMNLGLRSNILQGGALTARANAARNDLEAARAAADAADRDAALDGRKLARDISAGDRRSEMLERQIALLTETRGLYRSQYFDLGTRQLSELLDNEEEYYERQAELIELGSSLAASRLDCAVRDRSLRKAVGIADSSLYGFPLTPGG